MKPSIVLSMIAGVVAGVALVVACGGDDAQPPDAAADASACNCPTSEPPLAGRITIVETRVVDDGTVPQSASGSCGSGIALAVACNLQRGDSPISDTRNMTFVGSDIGSNAGFCDWRRLMGDPTRYLMIAKVTCLMPAAQ